ncbi:hypothetical protein H2200_007679 [Cladophialophora chaetospira]|uniref:Uncharacterized protein n=1 Tax=Cladophialophora chaetospira TaxID=386627 RepID=A0AA39CGB4_9EURO|nr:hypothetical protein H2200_007679 [Cladophialophora chaetospira]
MAEEAVIFPDKPLFMVDRGWQRRKKRAVKTASQTIHERELNLQPSRVPEVTITVAKGPGGTRSNSPPETKNHPVPIKSSHTQSVPIQFMNYEPPKPKKQRQPGSRPCPRNGQAATHMPRKWAAATKPEITREDLFVLKQSLPGTATSLYSVIDPEVSSFQEFISYYPTRLATAMYPISKSVPLTYNPIETVWFPAVVKDEVSLHAILFSCAMHYFLDSGQLTFRNSDVLMKVILNRLNGRLQDCKYSDLTIGAVSCLALCENHLGNHQKWKMHATGMSEMVRVRGGFQNVRDVLHMKIYRADTIGAVDTLTHPNFPRPNRSAQRLFSWLGLEAPDPPVTTMLADLGLRKTVLGALVELSYLCHALNHAADKSIPIDPLAFDEDVTSIQHDLLRSLTPQQEGVERLCVITALIFIQTLTREVPFTKLCSGHISKQLKKGFRALDAARAPARLIFWMLFMGGFVSSDTSERFWFQRRLGDFLQLRNDLTDWRDVKTELQKVFWVDSVQETLGLDLWDDINVHSSQKPPES